MRLIVSTDGTEHSNAAVEFVGSLGLADGDEILVISVIDLALTVAFDPAGSQPPTATDIEERFRALTESNLANAKSKLLDILAPRQIGVTTEILFGSPQRRIVERAEEWAADLIVVGSHGHSAWERILLGSVSDSVVHHSPCSVLVVRK